MPLFPNFKEIINDGAVAVAYGTNISGFIATFEHILKGTKIYVSKEAIYKM